MVLETIETRTCFGYVVRSALPFTLTRRGTGEPLDVTEHDGRAEPVGEPMLEWRVANGTPFARLHREGEGRYAVWIDRFGMFHVEPRSPTIAVPAGLDGPQREVRLWGLPVSLCLNERGDQVVHAAAVDVGGHAVLLAAPGTFGKTTLAAAFLQAGHRVLSEDVSCCHPGEEPFIWPGPAVLRVRRDVYDVARLRGTTVVAEDAERVQLSIDEPLRGGAAPVPLTAIVFLRVAEDGPEMRPVTPEQAVPDLWSLSFRLPTDDDRARCFRRVCDLLSRVPAYNLYRPLSLESLPEVVERIESTCIR